MPDGDIGALTEVIRKTAPNHPFEEHYNPTMVNLILAYHSWAIQQSIHLHTPCADPCEWHLVGPSILEVYLHENTDTGAHVITDLRAVAQEPIPEPFMPPRVPPRIHPRHAGWSYA